MNYKDILDMWKKRREAIQADYATGKFSMRDLGKKYEVTETRIMTIINEDKKSTGQG